MSSRKTIEKLGANPSKEEEINFIHEVFESIPVNSYLSGLLDGNFKLYIEQSIRNDFGIDGIDAIQTSELVKEREYYQARIKEAEEQLAMMARQLTEMRKELAVERNKAASAECKIQQAMKGLKGLY